MIGSVERFDTRGLRPPLCFPRVPIRELNAADMELSHPDMFIRISQAARQDPGDSGATTPRTAFTPPADSMGLIRSLCAPELKTRPFVTCLGPWGRNFAYRKTTADFRRRGIRFSYGIGGGPVADFYRLEFWGETEYVARIFRIVTIR